MSGIQNLELFRRDDKPIDKYLKSVALGVAVIQFFNCFFGYWISLDDEFKPEVDNWGSFTFGVILFYLVLTGTCFCAMLGTYQQWWRFMFATAVLYVIYFIFGLINVGLRANWFCFLLLFVAAIVNGIVGAHFRSIEQCQAAGHHFTCRGRCIRVEQAKRFDAMLFQNNGTLIRLFGYDSSSDEEPHHQHQQSPVTTPSPDTTKVSFTNDNHQEMSSQQAQQQANSSVAVRIDSQKSVDNAPAPGVNSQPFGDPFAPQPAAKPTTDNLLNF